MLDIIRLIRIGKAQSVQQVCKHVETDITKPFQTRDPVTFVLSYYVTNLVLAVLHKDTDTENRYLKDLIVKFIHPEMRREKPVRYIRL